MDEVPLTFGVPANRTVAVKVAKTVAVRMVAVRTVAVRTVAVRTSGHEKTHFTVAVACLQMGESYRL